ncbi:23S rRNA (guanosine(2251)-2'-O)-methyltransferase RlmB, partial [Cellulosimicrobium funkei]
MAGNSQRRGATRKPGSKKGATVGSGGQRRKGLEGRGPTPKAEDRVYHAAHKRKVADEKRATGRGGPARGTERAGTSRGGASRGGGPKGRGSVQEVVAGRNSVLEALRARIPVEVVYLASRLDADDRTREIVDIVAGRGYDLLEVGKPELDRLTDGAVHQGVAIKVPPYEYADVDDLLDAAEESGRPPLVVALDGVTDPRNLGAVLRSAGAFGAHGVLVPERRAAGVTASAWKVSAGAAARVPVARATNLVRALGELKKAGCFVVGLDAGGTTAIGDLELATEPLVVVAGSEGKGLSRLVREACDVVASIPIG